MELIKYEVENPGYGTIRIEDRFIGKQMVRLLMVNGAIETASFLTAGKEYDLFSDYLKGFNWIFQINPKIQKTLLIGGGGFAYPKYYIHTYPKKSIDVVEMNPTMVELAHEFFGLDDLIQKYDLENSKRLGIFIDRGERFLRETEKKYDAILNDAYIGKSFNAGLQSEKGLEDVKRHLNPGGIYVINFVGVPKGFFAGKCRRLTRRLLKYFKYTFLMPATEDISPYEKQNCLIFASDRELSMKGPDDPGQDAKHVNEGNEEKDEDIGGKEQGR